MHFGVTVATEQLEVVPVQTNARVPDVIRRQMDLVMDNNAWPVDPALKAALTQSAPAPAVCIAAVAPRLGFVKGGSKVLHGKLKGRRLRRPPNRGGNEKVKGASAFPVSCTYTITPLNDDIQ